MGKMDLDQLLITGADAERKEPPKESWPAIAAALQQKKKRRFFWIFPIPVLLVLGTGFYFFNKHNVSATTTVSTISEARKEISSPTSVVPDLNIPPTAIQTREMQNLSAIKSDNNLTNSNEKRFLSNPNWNEKISTSKNYLHKKNATIVTSSKQFKSFTVRSIKNPKAKKTVPKKPETVNEQIYADVQNPNTTEEILNETKAISSNDKVLEELQQQLVAKSDTETSPKPSVVVQQPVTGLMTPPGSIKVKSHKLWKPFLSVSYNKLYVKNSNFFSNYPTIQRSNNLLTGLNFNDIVIAPDYHNGIALQAGILWKRKLDKYKLKAQVGVQLNYGTFHSNVFGASMAKIFASNNTIVVDSAAIFNSNYAARPTSLLGFGQYNVKNEFLQFGFIAGLEKELFRIGKKQYFSVQTQITPVVTLSQSLLWFNPGSERYFTDKKLNRDINMQQSVALLFQTEAKKMTIAFGPNFNYNIFKLNKSVNNLNNIHNSSFGVQLQVGWKK